MMQQTRYITTHHCYIRRHLCGQSQKMSHLVNKFTPTQNDLYAVGNNSITKLLYFLSIFRCGYVLQYLSCVPGYTPTLLTASLTSATIKFENQVICWRGIQKSNHNEMILLAVHVAKLHTQQRKWTYKIPEYGENIKKCSAWCGQFCKQWNDPDYMKNYRFCSKQAHTKMLLSEGHWNKIGCEDGRCR
jgi:hypothetical protein